MKVHTLYECEICHRRYSKKEDAEECEVRGWAKPLQTGIIFGDAFGESHHDKNMTFCIAESEVDSHFRIDSLWACRDNGAGDSLGKQMCGGNREAELYEGNAAAPKHPTFKRMVKWLRENGIKPMMWNGKEVVPVKSL